MKTRKSERLSNLFSVIACILIVSSISFYSLVYAQVSAGGIGNCPLLTPVLLKQRLVSRMAESIITLDSGIDSEWAFSLPLFCR